MPIRAAPVSDESIPPIRLRIRPRRPPLPAPSACPSTFPTSSAAVNSSNQDATDITKRSIRQLRVAFEETPLKLRELEEGWRARRIRVLGEMTDQTVLVRGESRDGALMVSGVASIHQQRGLSKEPGNLPEFTCPIRRVSRNDIPTAKVLHIGPLRNAPTYAVGARPTRDPPEMQSVIRKIPIATAPPTPPASPRSSLRRPSSPPLVGPSVAPAGRPTAPHTALPILAQPLPPTSHPIPVSRGSPKDTIHVESHPSATELVISLKSGKQVIQVLRGGFEVVLDDRTLRSDEQSHWDIRQRKEWEMVQSLVERVKRSTPRLKILHALGHLTITCSSPPDVILSFHLGELASAHDTLRHRTDSVPIAQAKVRVTMSRLAEELRIDVSALYPERGSEEGAKGRSEKYRSKRFVLLNSPRSPVTNSDEKELFEESRIGLGISRIDDWREEELEVLRRLWALRDEWGRYG